MGPAELDDRELGYIDLLCSALFFLLDSCFLLFLSSFFLLPSSSILAPSWLILAPSWAILAPSWLILAPSWPILAPSWPILAPSWPHLGPSWLYLGPSWPHLGPSLAAVLSLSVWSCPHLGTISLVPFLNHSLLLLLSCPSLSNFLSNFCVGTRRVLSSVPRVSLPFVLVGTFSDLKIKCPVRTVPRLCRENKQ